MEFEAFTDHALLFVANLVRYFVQHCTLSLVLFHAIKYNNKNNNNNNNRLSLTFVSPWDLHSLGQKNNNNIMITIFTQHYPRYVYSQRSTIQTDWTEWTQHFTHR